MSSDPFQQLSDDAAASSAATERAARRTLGEAQAADATFVGSLTAAAEHDRELTVELATGARLRGRARAVAADHVVLVGEHGTAWVRLEGIATARVAPGERLDAVSGSTPTARGWAVTLADLLPDRPEVIVHVLGAASVRGPLTAVGQDMVQIRALSGPPGDLIVPTAAIAALVTRT